MTASSPPPHFAAVGGSTPFGLRPLGAGGSPRTRPPRPIHRAPRAPGLRSSAPRSRPSRTPLPQRRWPRLPGARSPTTSPSWRPTAPFPNPPTTRRIRHPLPSFLPNPPLPAAAQRQGPLDRLWRSRPPSRPGVTHPPNNVHIGEDTAEGGRTATFHVYSGAAPSGFDGSVESGKRRSKRRSPRRPNSRAPQTPGLIQSLLRYRSTWLAPSFVRLVLRKRSLARWPTHSPFRHFRASIPSFATPTVPRAGAGTTRCWPAVGLIRFRGLQVFGPLHGLPAPTRAFRRPPRAAPLRALRPRPSATPTPPKPPAIRQYGEPANRQKHYLIPVLN